MANYRITHPVSPEMIDILNESKLSKDPLDILLEYEAHFGSHPDPYSFEEWIRTKQQEEDND